MIILPSKLEAAARFQNRFLLACLSSEFDPSVVYASATHLQLLNLYRGMAANSHDCLGACTTGADALELVARLKPSLLFMVDDLPDSSLENLSRQAKMIHPGIRTWAAVSKPESLSPKTVIPIVCADQDLITNPDVLALASMAVVTNTTYRSPAILQHLNTSEPYGHDESCKTFQLTPRERQLLEAYALGLSNQETAQRLGLSVRTVQTYSSTLLQKLGVNNRQKALRRAISLGFNAVLRRFDSPESGNKLSS
jgi:DNA-binding NarL/FixJ family response regulator